MERAVEAICSLHRETVYWPDEEERKVISEQMQKNYDFINCVGMGDGTLFPLAYAPCTPDASDYSGRKYGYSITCFIINDDKRRIRSYLAGWPGSTHDNRVFGKMRVNRHPASHFSPTEYILSDSALENCSFVVAAFKKPYLKMLPREDERFNNKLASARIIAEHTIGILNGRFPCLKRIRMRITDEKESMKKILQMIDCCIILHNLLIPEDGGDDVDEEWLDNGDISDVDDDTRVPGPRDRLYRPLPQGSRKDERRRRLQTYLELKEYCR